MVHFVGKYEVEFKYRLQSKADFLQKLKLLAVEVMLEDNAEYDCYFDMPNNTLGTQRKSVCIREMLPSGIKLWIVKGPEKDRCEAVDISDSDRAKSMLLTMGFEQVLELHKTRSIYFLGKFHITVDNLAGIGDFAELAIMTDDESALTRYRAELLELAIQLGLTPEMQEHQSYRQLQQALQANGH
ncbi:class IV adenylate cyclase [Shewanella sp. 1CM18E]|uniref:class IV adenylate cyclase n=1 Tax=Shewanella sp. 1CM18E TaxID=2929169 RepID=UPI0020BDC304|nr:class IV adenylate cyclase [Shewanella sp. 1CM18E]MCK8043785.1 class IV adenylate cyclase [Shewanella sp. 1CM18E]